MAGAPADRGPGVSRSADAAPSVVDLALRPSAPVVGRPTRDGAQAEAARRILEAAAPLFYRQGIRAVSADAVIDAAGVTKATFYRHFPTKDELVVAYLTAIAAAEQHVVTQWRAELADQPDEVLTRYARTLGRDACGPGFHGCPFLNALAEYPDAEHPVRVAAQQHRRWLRAAAGELLKQMGVAEPQVVALELMMLRDGAMAAGDDVPGDQVAQALLGAGRAVVRGGARPAEV